jgi:hypothetical protein
VTLRNRFPAWFDAARFREAFVLEPAGLPLAETLYSATPLPPQEGIGVDVQLEYVDDRGDVRAEIWRRIEEIDGQLVATHVAFTVIDYPPHPKVRFQRRGIARRAMLRAIILYGELGVRGIGIAATNAGRFVWPKFGFELTPHAYSEFIDLVDAEHRRLFGAPYAGTIARSGRHMLDFEIAGRRLGESALRARPAWKMQLDLTSPVSRAILSEELLRE